MGLDYGRVAMPVAVEDVCLVLAVTMAAEDVCWAVGHGGEAPSHDGG